MFLDINLNTPSKLIQIKNIYIGQKKKPIDFGISRYKFNLKITYWKKIWKNGSKYLYMKALWSIACMNTHSICMIYISSDPVLINYSHTLTLYNLVLFDFSS